MNGMTLWLVLAGAEVGLVVFGLLVFFWLSALAERRRLARAVRILVDKVKANKGEREARIEAFLREGLGLEGEALRAARVPIVREEMRLYQTFANLVHRRDPGGVAAFDLAVEAAVQPYAELQLAGPPAPVADQGQGEGSADLEQLREENQRLTKELQVTMDTMSRMLSEYSTMFMVTDAAEAEEAPSEGEEGTAEAPGAAVEEVAAAPAAVEGAPEETPSTEAPPDPEPTPVGTGGEDVLAAEMESLFDADEPVDPEPAGEAPEASVQPPADQQPESLASG